jgi:PBP1b-binding outer membrane lipoprotein LpoB
MKKWIAILFFGLLLAGCCQPEGAYEKCLEQEHALCIDIYPKCEETKK